MSILYSKCRVSTLFATLAISTAGFGCSDERVATGELRASLEEGCEELGEYITNHSCGHGSDGSGESVTGSTNLTFGGANPNIDDPHTYWTINLPVVGMSRRGTVKFTPWADGDFAIYQQGTVPFTVTPSGGSAISPVLAHDVGGCAYLSRVRVYSLDDSVTYYLTFGTTASTTTNIAIERVNEFNISYYADNDADTYGDLFDEVVTACEAPEGYVVNSEDCDDTNASIHPGVADPPGGADLNCDGIP
jgi:hypothetical protein